MIRIFGADECDNCLLAISYLDDLSLEYEYVDAFSEEAEIEKLCEDYDIDDLPHIQILNKEGTVTKEFVGIKDIIDNFKEIMNK